MAKNKQKESPGEGQVKNEKKFPIVAIGASAGGLEALETLFSSFPAHSGCCFIIIQHLSATHKSIMASLLEKFTDMNIYEVTDGITLEKNSLYLNPAGKNMSLMDNKLYLSNMDGSKSLNLPIDYFFCSLARHCEDKAVSIVLSGTGSDGMQGVKAVKNSGGLVIAQDQNQAKYDGMPRSAVSTGMVDFILPVEKMGGEIMGYITNVANRKTNRLSSELVRYNKQLNEIFALINARTGHDFSHYKKNTIFRRIERRLAVHQIEHLSQYTALLRKSPDEIHNLFKDLLIGVTGFFRDAEAFAIIKNNALPAIIGSKKGDSPIRIWIPGCATGEEAYSIAILLLEVMEKLEKFFPVQIFATDIDNVSINVARSAVFPAASVENISGDRLKRYFIKADTSFKICKQVRDMIVFSTQDLIKDPPFSRLDMICCRNVLIYMDQVLQTKLLPLFHYILNNEGILFLGSSESIGEYADCFSPLNSKWKIFTRKKNSDKRDDGYQSPSFGEIVQRDLPVIDKIGINKKEYVLNAEKIILENYAAPCVLIDGKYDILYFTGNTDRFLSPPVGEPSFNILKMARDDLRYKLGGALLEASKKNIIVHEDNILIKGEEKLTTVNIVVRPLTGPKLSDHLMIVVFEDNRADKEVGTKKSPGKAEKEPRITKLEQELQSTKEYLQTTIEELETSNEELKSTNEELQSVNEELQSTNEELETSKEELQSTNEELVTVNSELQSKVDELSQVNNDISNLLASTEIGTIFLDIHLRIMRFTPAMKKIFNLIDSDVNRPISDITSTIDYKDLFIDSKEVLDTLVRKEIEVMDNKENYYSMKISPYRTTENVIEGLVITFVDITRLKKSRVDLEESEERYKTIAKMSEEGIYQTDLEGIIVFANSIYAGMFGFTPEEFVGKNWNDYISPGEKKKAEEIKRRLLAGEYIKGEKVGIRKEGKEVKTVFNAGPLRKNGKIIGIIGTIKEVKADG